VGGHLQLLKEDVGAATAPIQERFEIIDGQLGKIADIVKNFLQSTAKPTSQRQLVDLNRLADKTVGIVRPRLESMGVEVKRDFDRSMGPVRVVPLDLEQILLNLLNNSLDSMKAKTGAEGKGRLHLDIATGVAQLLGKEWAQVSVYDTGEGIARADIKNVLKPFYTTKRPGEGTGLGLTICQQLATKYGGVIDIDSKEGAWTRVTVRIPYIQSG
jgi:signal transduction histidine kinase